MKTHPDDALLTMTRMDKEEILCDQQCNRLNLRQLGQRHFGNSHSGPGYHPE